MPSQKPSLTVRIPDDLKESLKIEAEKQDRSVGSMITVILRNYFNQLAENNNAIQELDSNSKKTYEKLKNLPFKERQAILKNLLNND
jgi:plasmid stability protein